MPNIKHAFVSAKADGADATLIQLSNWNAEHVVEDYLDYPALAGIPAAPGSGLRSFARARAGRLLPHVIGPSGIDVALQPAFFANSIYLWLPGTGTTVTGVAGVQSAGAVTWRGNAAGVGGFFFFAAHRRLAETATAGHHVEATCLLDDRDLSSVKDHSAITF